jgi:hypothetical protein
MSSEIEGRGKSSAVSAQRSATESPVAVIAIAFVGIRPDAEVETRLDAEIAAPLAEIATLSVTETAT